MFVFKADNMLLHQFHSIPELKLQNIRMAPQKKPQKQKKNPNNLKKTPKNLKIKRKTQPPKNAKLTMQPKSLLTYNRFLVVIKRAFYRL